MKLTGRAFIDIAGIGRIRTKQGGATLNMGGFTREGEAGDLGVNGYKEAVAIPSIELQVSHAKDIDEQAINDLTNNPVTFETDTGRVLVLQEAWTSSPVTIGSNGDMSWTMQGTRVDKVK